jgi:hypothetical protein
MLRRSLTVSLCPECSVIAGFGAKATSLADLFDEHRSVSFAGTYVASCRGPCRHCAEGLSSELTRSSAAVGGDSDVEQVLTLGTILREYNPHLKGLTNCAGSIHAHNLNMAVSGATVQGPLIVFIDPCPLYVSH